MELRLLVQFVAADLMPDTPREDLRALGYLGAAPVYHTDLRLSKDVTKPYSPTIGMNAWMPWGAACSGSPSAARAATTTNSIPS